MNAGMNKKKVMATAMAKVMATAMATAMALVLALATATATTGPVRVQSVPWGKNLKRHLLFAPKQNQRIFPNSEIDEREGVVVAFSIEKPQ